MSLPQIIGVGAGLIGAASGTYLGVRTGAALERSLPPDEKEAVEGALATLIPTAKVIGPAANALGRLDTPPDASSTGRSTSGNGS